MMVNYSPFGRSINWNQLGSWDAFSGPKKEENSRPANVVSCFLVPQVHGKMITQPQLSIPRILNNQPHLSIPRILKMHVVSCISWCSPGLELAWLEELIFLFTQKDFFGLLQMHGSMDTWELGNSWSLANINEGPIWILLTWFPCNQATCKIGYDKEHRLFKMYKTSFTCKQSNLHLVYGVPYAPRECYGEALGSMSNLKKCFSRDVDVRWDQW